MSDKSSIEWTDATWNPVTGCTKVSPGCDNCYAERVTERFYGPASFQTVRMHPKRLDQPLRWRRPRMVFVNSMSDLFHPSIPGSFLAEIFAVMSQAPQHTFQVLTKRHGRMHALLTSEHFRSDVHSRAIDLVQARSVEHAVTWPLPNVWLGVSVEDQHWHDVRVAALVATPAAVRFLSCEPLLGPIKLTEWIGSGGLDESAIDWVITGGESGPGARPCDPDWVRQIRDDCVDAGVAFFHKQWGGVRPKTGGRDLDGRTWDQMPEPAA